MRQAIIAAYANRWGKRGMAPFAVTTPPQQAASGGRSPLTFGKGYGDFLTVRVELLLGGVWVDISSRVAYNTKVVIRRGRQDGQTSMVPAQAAMTLLNSDDLFSPRNPNSEYRGLLKRGVKLRVWANPGSGDSLRFTGRVPNWEPKRNVSTGKLVPIVAYGQWRKISRGDEPLQSPIYRATVAANPLFYVPMEEGTDGTQFASGLLDSNGNATGSGFQTSGAFSYAANSTLPGSKAMPEFSDTSNLLAPHLGVSINGHWQADWMMYFDATTVPVADTVIMQVWTFGSIQRWNVSFVNGNGYVIHGYTPDGTLVINDGIYPFASAFYGQPTHHRLMVKDAGGGNLTYAYVIFSLSGTGNSASATVTGTIGAPDAVQIFAQPELDGLVYGHIALYDAYDFSAVDAAMAGYNNETPASGRFKRLCVEEGLDYTVRQLLVPVNDIMGPQKVASLTTNLLDAEETSEGFMDESFDDKLRLTGKTWLWNANPDLVCDYAASQVFSVEPADDDLLLRNQWSITRDGGSTMTYRKDTGPNNSMEPEDDPQGAGLYKDSATLSVRTDAGAAQHASLRVARGTVDAPRLRHLVFNLYRNPELTVQWAYSCDTGSVVQVRNPPPEMGRGPSGDSLQWVTGYVETLAQDQWMVDAATLPAEVDQATGVLDQYGFTDCKACTVNIAFDTTATGFSTHILDSCFWSTRDGPFRIKVGDEWMRVTSVSGVVAGEFQDLQVDRALNGVLQDHAAGEEVHVLDPFILG